MMHGAASGRQLARPGDDRDIVANGTQPKDELRQHALHAADRADVVRDDRHCARRRGGARRMLSLEIYLHDSQLVAAAPGAELKLAGPGHGYVSDDELLALYRGAAVLVLPSLYEGFGFPLAEAMACGTPCIASDDPALVEVSGGAALHFPRSDAGALRLLLRRVLGGSALRDELSRKGLERARAFRWDRCAALHVEVYREAAR